MRDLPFLENPPCPYCLKEAPESVCYYDSKTEEASSYEFICSECSRVFVITLSNTEISKRINRIKAKSLDIMLEATQNPENKQLIETIKARL